VKELDDEGEGNKQLFTNWQSVMSLWTCTIIKAVARTSRLAYYFVCNL